MERYEPFFLQFVKPIQKPYKFQLLCGEKRGDNKTIYKTQLISKCTHQRTCKFKIEVVEVNWCFRLSQKQFVGGSFEEKKQMSSMMIWVLPKDCFEPVDNGSMNSSRSP